MSIFEKTKHCTKRFPCRFKLAMMIFYKKDWAHVRSD